jgi:nucleotide-binding universal stress UspA family protein
MYHRILVPLDGSELAELALAPAALLARRFHAQLWLVHVLAPVPLAAGASVRLAGTAVDQAQDYLQDVQRRLEADGLAVRAIVRWGDPAGEILATAQEGHADLIAMATHGRGGLGRWMIGSVADRVVRTATIPVLVVPARAAAAARQPGFRRLLVPLDGSALAEEALPHALLIARMFNATVELLSVVPRSDLTAYPESWFPDLEYEALKAQRQRYLDDLGARLQQRGLRIETALEAGDVPETIVRIAQSRAADLIVMATHGRGGIMRWVLGSVAAKLLAAAPVPLLLVRAASAPTPRNAPATAGDS